MSQLDSGQVLKAAFNDVSKALRIENPGMPAYNSFTKTQPDPSDTTEQYKFYWNGTLVATINLTYSDSTKAVLIAGTTVL